ncbi:DUF4905 domain-containing protein [Rhodocytophaga aerolata]|uniref:DUF4905 domain-containing protein n=1 Tax=Rhodocytophaga aerolata TaxID=455078 RepID=A0ABT8RAY9_9BACT|nr:DUF4905 domain-containing protein [Rhodocytophaga aerolata]MDO1447912.1 DUF4905 domain-containing protein [Rhodocytophaga aerolata]
MVKKLSSYFSFTLPGNIWRMLASEHWLVAEIRDGQTRKANFAAVDIRSGRLQWDYLELPESWWVSGTTIQTDTLLVQLYPDPQQPQTKGIIAIDLPTGTIRWQQPQHSFLRLTEQGILAVQGTEGESIFQLLSLATGEVVSRIEPVQLDDFSSPAQPYLLLPTHYTQENTYFGSIVSFIHHKLGLQPQKAVDYAEFQQLISISYYIYEHKNLTNYLLILDKEGNVRLHERLASQLPGIGLDTFFIIHQYLIVVKDKKDLIAYEL